jgi:hypothetical protein
MGPFVEAVPDLRVCMRVTHGASFTNRDWTRRRFRHQLLVNCPHPLLTPTFVPDFGPMRIDKLQI